MPINDAVLHQAINSHIKVSDTATMRDAFTRYKAADGQPWWRLVVQRQDGSWAVTTFRDLDALASSLGAAFFDQPIRDLPIPFTTVIAVDQDRYTTNAAQRLALDSPEQLLVVTKNGQLVGILVVGTRRSAAEKSDGPSAVDLFERLPPTPPAASPSAPGGLSVPEPAAAAADQSAEVFFRAYYPREAVVAVRHSLYIYAYIQAAIAAIERDIQRFKDEFGGDVPAPKSSKQSARLQPGTLITVTPVCDALEFNPPALTKKWDDDWLRFDFDFKPPASAAGDTLTVQALITVSGVEIASIKFAIEAVDTPPTAPSPPTPNTPATPASASHLPAPDNPLAAAKLSSETAQLYQKIFISYSRADKAVAESYRLAQLAMGNDVFMDTYSIRAGDNWQAALARAIDMVDVFQLFWSENSAKSPNVRDEWAYALQYRCPATKCAGFIRAVFWQQPLVSPPPELSHLNFRYVPLITQPTA
ncbi:MAG: toll/interleukin-1 receptor domain-containing protein [Anaerolineae bacterium]|nr:toll/interleukin-1 receptor domain-containing protein [Anaerolineae bacterium]